MKLPTEKIEALCAPQYPRTANAHYVADEQVLVATDGCAMALAKAEAGTDDHTGAVSPEAIRKARANGGTVSVSTPSEFSGWKKPLSGLNAKIAISLDAALLYKLASAICTDDQFKNVTLYLHGLESPILVQPVDSEYVIGVMMPIRTYEPQRKSGDIIKKFFSRKAKGGAA